MGGGRERERHRLNDEGREGIHRPCLGGGAFVGGVGQGASAAPRAPRGALAAGSGLFCAGRRQRGIGELRMALLHH
jgi:hypothetical protein